MINRITEGPDSSDGLTRFGSCEFMAIGYYLIRIKAQAS